MKLYYLVVIALRIELNFPAQFAKGS